MIWQSRPRAARRLREKGVKAVAALPHVSRPPIADGTSPEDLAVFLAGWLRYRALAAREDRVRYDARLHPLLERLEEHVAALRLLAAMPPGEFLADPWRFKAAQLHLFLGLAAAIDATKWLAGKVRVRGRPRGFADAFDLLTRAGALPVERRHVYLGMARLRNWIAHEAVTLPPRKVRALVRFFLPELEAFARLLGERVS